MANFNEDFQNKLSSHYQHCTCC